MRKSYLNKILSFLVLSALCFSLFSVFSHAEDEETYTTTDGNTFTVDQLDLCWGDLEDISANATQQEVIDIFYRKTFTSIEVCSSGYEDDYGSDYSDSSEIWFEYQNVRLNQHEITLFLNNIGYINPVKAARQTAINWARVYYPEECSDGQKGNAFQHAFWVMSMYYNTSPAFALDLAEAHENYANNPILHKTMDLANNQTTYNYCVSLNNDNADLTNEQIKNHVIDLINNGSLTYIIPDYEYPEVIYVDRLTGLETSRTMATADLYAYTNSTVPYNIPDPIIRYTNVSIGFQGILPEELTN